MTNGVAVLGGELFIYDLYSSTTLGGNSLIDANGSLNDYGGGAPGGGAVILNGNINVGSLGTNTLTLPNVGGIGTILQTGGNDVTGISGSVGSGVDLDIRSGKLVVGSSFGYVAGTIGPANGKGPSLGPSASFTFFTAGFNPSDVETATFDTSTGLLSFMDARGQTLYNPLHLSGDASGLNVSTAGGGITITDHPGSISPISITFS